MAGAVLFALLLAGSIIGVAYAVVNRRFRRSPEWQWRERVFNHSAELILRRRWLQSEAPPSPQEAVESERQAAMAAARKRIPLDRVMEQPGIGQHAVSLLRASGVGDIPTVLSSRLEAINGIGPQKAATLRFAAERLMATCDEEFRSGRSLEGVAFASRIDGIRSQAASRYEQHGRELRAVDAAISAHRSEERLAAEVTLKGYLTDHVIVGLDAERMQRSFVTPEWMLAEPPPQVPTSVGTSPVKAPADSQSQASAEMPLSLLAEFGMFLVRFGGANQRHRMIRLRLALQSKFESVPERDILAELNRYLKTNRRPDEWFSQLASRTPKELRADCERLVNQVLGPKDLLSDDERRLAEWIARGGKRAPSPSTTNSNREDGPTPNERVVPSPSKAIGKVSAKAVTSPPPPASADLMKEALLESNSASIIEPVKRHAQQDKLEALARFGMMVALADGRAAQTEVQAVRSYLAETFGHEPVLARWIDPLIELSTAAKPLVDETIKEVSRLSKGPDELKRLYRWAEQIADASSGRNDREAALLAKIAGKWELTIHSERRRKSSPSPAERPVRAEAAQPPVPASDLRGELGIPADTELTAELVRRRYHLLVDQLDSVRLEGLGDEFSRLASLKRGRIEAAALGLLAQLGATLALPSAPPVPDDLRHNPDLDAMFGA